MGPGLIPFGWSGAAAEAEDGGGLPPPERSLGRLALSASCYLSVGVLALGCALATMLEAFEASRLAARAAPSGPDGRRCAVCGLTAEEALAAGVHVSDHGHDPESYLLYLLYLRSKRRAAEPLTSLEASVERRAAALDLSFFPRAAEGSVPPAEEEAAEAAVAKAKGARAYGTSGGGSGSMSSRRAAWPEDELDATTNEIARAMRNLLGMDGAGERLLKPRA